ncbi:FAD-dependent monooxygenase [Pistricoccus aurantiacus]|uniref:FAD-dependent monooxygenase n=1 Tax=Pistricoccus aurantiacus TaxID=1883414 RepID=UPI001646CFEB|nr:FAD-dependent monooxygenase [Pistricoccus aurantiacus]
MGLAVALFLDSHGVGVRLVDKSDHPSTTSWTQFFNPRSLELLEASGVTANILKESHS